MATYQVRDGFFTDMSTISYSVLFSGTEVVADKKMYVLDLGDGFADFRGEGFKYAANGTPKAGTVEKYFVYDGDMNQAVSFTGFEIGVKAFVKAASTAGTTDDQKLLATMLSGNDKINGADLADGLMGYAGKDTLYGAGGADFLMGGAGNDKYVYRAVGESTLEAIDTILGFAHGDKIALATIANFDFIGQGAYTGNGPEVAWTVIDGDTYVIADADGDMDTDLAIKIDGAFTLTEADFIL